MEAEIREQFQLAKRFVAAQDCVRARARARECERAAARGETDEHGKQIVRMLFADD